MKFVYKMAIVLLLVFVSNVCFAQTPIGTGTSPNSLSIRDCSFAALDSVINYFQPKGINLVFLKSFNLTTEEIIYIVNIFNQVYAQGGEKETEKWAKELQNRYKNGQKIEFKLKPGTRFPERTVKLFQTPAEIQAEIQKVEEIKAKAIESTTSTTKMDLATWSILKQALIVVIVLVSGIVIGHFVRRKKPKSPKPQELKSPKPQEPKSLESQETKPPKSQVEKPGEVKKE